MNTNQPFFSIIIPTHNRPRRLKRCLNSIARLDYPVEKFEVIVVDDGSSKDLEKFLPLDNGLKLNLIKQSQQGPAAARNRGAKLAKGDFLAFTDDDCMPDANWISVLADFFSNNPKDMIGGKTVNALSQNPFSSASQTLISYIYSYYNTNSRKTKYFTSNNMAMSKKIFQEVGGFDHEWGLAAAEDREFCDRWQSNGFKMRYIPEAVVYHAHEMSINGFLRQHYSYGRGAYYFHQKRFQRNKQKLKIEPLSFYLDLVKFPFSKFGRWRAMVIIILLMMAQGANAVGYFSEKFKQRKTINAE